MKGTIATGVLTSAGLSLLSSGSGVKRSDLPASDDPVKRIDEESSRILRKAPRADGVAGERTQHRPSTLDSNPGGGKGVEGIPRFVLRVGRLDKYPAPVSLRRPVAGFVRA
mgnify:CR=1 FL=1